MNLEMQKVVRKSFRNPEELTDALRQIVRSSERWQFDKKIGERWYPVSAREVKYDTTSPSGGIVFFMPSGGSPAEIPQTTLAIQTRRVGHEQNQGFCHQWTPPTDLKIADLLELHELRLHTRAAESGYQDAQKRAAELTLQPGKVLACHGQRWATGSFFGMQFTYQSRRSNYGEERVIVEPTHEYCCDTAPKHAREAVTDPPPNYLPFVRVYSLSERQYIEVDVRDLREPVWDDSAITRLVLDPERLDFIERLLASDISKFPPDVFREKHGGLVILAEGPSGVGKTLTAEVMAEKLHKALYVVDAHDLGSTAEQIEEGIKQTFTRAARWNVVVLLDEADVFLAKRGEDLAKNAIVSCFLRKMDYFKGVLFLTTNLGTSIDPAFASRVLVHLRFDLPGENERCRLWRVMSEHAGLHLDGHVDGLSKIKMNGREIRNVVRLGVMLYGQDVTAEQLHSLADFRVRAQ